MMSPNILRKKADILLLAFGAVLLLVSEDIAPAEVLNGVPIGSALTDDRLLAGFIKDALEKRPELTKTRAMIKADLERVPQVSALPDPIFSLGIQNDGFRKIQIGEMESSYLSVMSTHTFPWYGKRDLRGQVVTLGVRQAEADLKRAQLSIQADVERGYIDLLLTRDRLGLLTKLETLWTQTEGMARVRYESGDGAQSDILRAQLERSRLKLRRWSLEAGERAQVAILNRLIGHPLDNTIATKCSLADISDPLLPDLKVAFEVAEGQSPELQKARFAIERSDKLVDLAEKDWFPDLALNAGLMPRWGKFDPMWQAGLSFSIPVWGDNKQSRLIEESRIRGTAEQYGAEAIRQLLRQRVTERLTLQNALVETNRLYRSGLLVLSEATVSSTMAQYQVGRVTFASVLEALSGYLADINAFYESIAAVQRVDIAQREMSLDPVTNPISGGMDGSPVPGAGGMGGNSSGSPASPSQEPGGNTGSGSMSRM